MVRLISGVVVGYIAMFAFVFLTFTALYFLLGVENTFEPETYMVSTMWIVISTILSIVAALLGGFICMLIAKNQKAVFSLAALVLILGLIMAIPVLTNINDEVYEMRKLDVPNMEAMQKAKQPPLIALLNPIIGAVGVVLGAKLKKTDDA